MKNAKVITTLFFAALFAACSSGGGSNVLNDGPVSVCLNVEAPASGSLKAVASGDNVNNLSYYYTAMPQWDSSESSSIQGAVSTMKKFSNGDSLGEFQPGYWLFSVEVRNTVEQATSVVYAGSAYTYINSDAASVTVNVSPSDGTGTVNIAVYVPTSSENESMSIGYSGSDSASGIQTDASRITSPGTYQNYTMFTKVIPDLPAGGYTFILDYSDGTTLSSISGGAVCGASVDVNVASGATTTITGTIEGGALRAITPSVITPGFSSFTMTQGDNIPAGSLEAPGVTAASENTDTIFTVSCIPKDGTVINSYEWYLNSVPQETGDISYNLNTQAGTYVLTCVVTGTSGNRTFTASVKSIVIVQ
ncbi:MAG: hypothetical protein IJQ86_08570 [Spirochaetia bacterium]|nr:hypothetical protein [Spirochaetia bacterium]